MLVAPTMDGTARRLCGLCCSCRSGLFQLFSRITAGAVIADGENEAAVLVVAGLSIRNLQPRVWDPSSPFHIPSLSAVMVSYGEFHQERVVRAAAMERGLRGHLNVPESVKVYLDNGAFHFGFSGARAPVEEYEHFVEQATPDWKPIPHDYIPFPSMTAEQRRKCFEKTMCANARYQHNGYVPVVHIGSHLVKYTARVSAHGSLSKKPWIALGGIVPNLLRKPKAMRHTDVLKGLRHVRLVFNDKQIHVFGVGGTATLHLTALLGFDSVDSSGWRNCAGAELFSFQAVANG